MNFIISKNELDPRRTWGCAIEEMACPPYSMLDRFDQSGYDLCPLEQEYAKANMTEVAFNKYRRCIRKDWLETIDIYTNAHVNHADLYERKGYHGYALEQLNHWADGAPWIYKLSMLKPKWGIDISIDYADNSHNVFELFHFEWDSHDFDEVVTMKEYIEEILLDRDWDFLGKQKLERKYEWHQLDFVGQSEWTTKFLGLPKERFKLVPWQ